LTLYGVFRGLRGKNLWLVLISLIFYAWGDIRFLPVLLASIFLNYLFGLLLDREDRPSRRKLILIAALVLNLGLLSYYKYLKLVGDTFNFYGLVFHLSPVRWQAVRLPIGISFLTFHAISYVMDVYRRKSNAARNPSSVALYILFFPQLIAGPILRWSAIAPQIASRSTAPGKFADGIRRFVYGLAKKMLIANAVALPANKIFALPPGELSPALAWFGALCYTLQIYYDFSGYSDMAIGMGKMFGFDFIENFNFPYIAQSIQDFWRRWHISLSSWFRDYLYIPLGGNRGSTMRTFLNLVVVFFLCGLWHGASLTFVIWGLYHGIFLVLERTRWGGVIASLSSPFRHFYALLVVMIGWVFFRATTFGEAVTFLSFMFGFRQGSITSQSLDMHLTNQVAWAIVIGILFSMPVYSRLKAKWNGLATKVGETEVAFRSFGFIAEPVVLIVLLVVSAAWLAGGTYNPFIYFQF
ncbi:MAG: MBOAT family O-acyltransferase, partial [Limisphaerales bacterium]